MVEAVSLDADRIVARLTVRDQHVAADAGTRDKEAVEVELLLR